MHPMALVFVLILSGAMVLASLSAAGLVIALPLGVIMAATTRETHTGHMSTRCHMSLWPARLLPMKNYLKDKTFVQGLQRNAHEQLVVLCKKTI